MGFDEWWEANARFGDDKVRLRQLWSAAIECAQRETVRYAEAQVAAERERLRALVHAVRDANRDAQDGATFRLLKPGQERAWMALLAGLEGPNVADDRHEVSG